MFRVVNQLKSYLSVETLRKPLQEADPDVFKLILAEKQRQIEGINLIAS